MLWNNEVEVSDTTGAAEKTIAGTTKNPLKTSI